jgi:hypothetical protein
MMVDDATIRAVLEGYVSGDMSRHHAMAALGLADYQTLIALMHAHQIVPSDSLGDAEGFAAKLMAVRHDA